MNLLRQPIQRKLSSLLGTPVEIAQLDVSLLKGSALARGVRIAGLDPARPLLELDGIRFDISIRDALQKRIVVKSLTLDRPTVNLRRSLDGRWNIPQRTKDESEEAAEDVADSNWAFDVSKMLMVDGQINVTLEMEGGSYELRLGPLVGEIARELDVARFTFLGQSLQCAGRPMTAGEIKLAGKLQRFHELRRLGESSLVATFDAEPNLRLHVSSDRLDSGRLGVALDSAVELAELVALLPPLPLLAPLRRLNLRGPVRLSTELTLTADVGK